MFGKRPRKICITGVLKGGNSFSAPSIEEILTHGVPGKELEVSMGVTKSGLESKRTRVIAKYTRTGTSTDDVCSTRLDRPRSSSSTICQAMACIPGCAASLLFAIRYCESVALNRSCLLSFFLWINTSTAEHSLGGLEFVLSALLLRLCIQMLFPPFRGCKKKGLFKL